MFRKLCIGLIIIGTIAITVSCSGKTNDLSKEAMANNNVSSESSKIENNKTNGDVAQKANKSSHQSSYKIISETYDDNQGTKISYPQITDFNDAEKQKKLNETIKNEALKGNNYYKDVDGKVTIDIKYEIVCQEPEILSIIYSGVGNVSGAAHPSNLFYTTNLDIINNKKLRLNDIVDVNDDFVNMLIIGKFKAVNSDYEAQYKSDINISSLDDWKKRLLAADPSDNMGSEFCYMTKDSLGLSVGVIHALGDHAEFEIKYKDIWKYIKLKDDAHFQDFFKTAD
ncbi:hypothetical protein [Candidatus Clostridium helianthi]|jgi:hypothetical protein|uniref:DUF4163 domain-containing protein n=1 Tax=Candidatus Clostridium helianthi TaxID=3381660 RepID=A0ABW8S5S4_9CLOT